MLKAYDLLRQVLIERLRQQGNVALRIDGKIRAQTSLKELII